MIASFGIPDVQWGFRVSPPNQKRINFSTLEQIKIYLWFLEMNFNEKQLHFL